MQIYPCILHVKICILHIQIIKGSFFAGHLDWRRNISLREVRFLFWGKKRYLIYGETIHSAIRKVFSKCQSLLSKCYELISPLLRVLSITNLFSLTPTPSSRIFLQ